MQQLYRHEEHDYPESPETRSINTISESIQEYPANTLLSIEKGRHSGSLKLLLASRTEKIQRHPVEDQRDQQKTQ